MRSFLLVQGNASWFFRRLGEGLAARGHRVTRINICGGDRLYWGRDGWNAIDYRERPEVFETYLDDAFERWDVTDLVVFNDCRPTHRVAIAAAKRAAITIWVFEEGYLRPDWITLERDGINGHSRLPADPAWYLETAHSLPAHDTDHATGGGLRQRILQDFRWQAANYTQAWRYPHYRTHRPYPIWAEYSTWLTRLAVLRRRQAAARNLIKELVESRTPFCLFPLQLDSDSQIRVHSPFQSMKSAIESVISNFAAYAPSRQHLVIKNHPLDNGWINYRRLIGRQAHWRGVADRVHFIDGGDLLTLIDQAMGTVTVNSTVGLTALDRGRPLKCLGRAIYDIPGLTFNGPLKSFWKAAPVPYAHLYDAFRRVVRQACLVNGNFYTEDGMALAVEGSVARMVVGDDILAGAPSR